MTFAVAAESYDRFMGRYSVQLTSQLADYADVQPGQHVLDVGCGPGALTTELVARLGAGAVTAADPSESFVEAARARHRGVQVALAPAEDLPFEDDAFDAALAQLVVHFMSDPVAGLGEMRRVTRPGGFVAASVWDHAGDRSPLTPFWRAARELHPRAPGEDHLAGIRDGHLAQLMTEAGLTDVEQTAHAVHVEHATFEEWWEPFTFGVGPAGAFVARLDDAAAAELRERCRSQLGDGPIAIDAQAWAARGRA
jgi:ubiquinone/menaquinone biosynthesis C-methylase UbiE